MAVAGLLLVGQAIAVLGSDEVSDEGARAGFSGSVEVRVGTVTVVVRDKKDQPVTGLSQEDFVLFVNGNQREITNFAEVREGAALLETEQAKTQPGQMSADGVETVEARAQPRLLAVVVDSDNISIFNRKRVIQRAGQFIEDSVRPPNLGMVLTNERYPKVHCPPTTNSQEVYEALRGLLKTTSGLSSNRNAIRLAEDAVFEAKQGRDSFQRDSAISLVRMTAGQIDDSLRRSIGTLKTICRALGGFGGKKDVLFVSDGLPLIPGEELFRLLEVELGYREALTEMHGLYRAPLFEELANQAIAADVAIHTLDARGLIVQGGSAADSKRSTTTSIGFAKTYNYQDSLRYLSATTGGVAVLNTNNFEKGLEQVEEAIASYYSIGFSLDETGGDRLHTVKIELPGQSDSRLLYRKDFFERSVVSLSADRTMTGLLVAPPDNTLGVEIAIANVVPGEKKRWTAEVLVDIPLQILSAVSPTRGSVANITLLAVAASENGRTPISRTSHSIALSEGGGSSLQLQMNLDFGPGINRVSVGVLDETSGLDGYATAEWIVED